MEAYRTAEDVLNDPAASRTILTARGPSFWTRYTIWSLSLVIRAGWKTQYEILKNLEEDHYTSTGWDAFQEALDRAEEVLADDEEGGACRGISSVHMMIF